MYDIYRRYIENSQFFFKYMQYILCYVDLDTMNIAYIFIWFKNKLRNETKTMKESRYIVYHM